MALAHALFSCLKISNMMCFEGSWIFFALTVFLFASPPMQSQSGAKGLAGTQSIGDVIERSEHVGATRAMKKSTGPAESLVKHAPLVHILYMHGINQIGPLDSALLQKSICKYIGECTVTKLGRVYADGPFAVNVPPPTLAYMQARIWNTQEDWKASAPFIDRYEIAGSGHAPILLDELNWWPLAYPLKCKWLIAHEAALTGPSKQQMEACTVPSCTVSSECSPHDPDHPERYLRYQWIPPGEAAELNHYRRRATFLNRSLKNGLMDWGFGDAVMALGPMQEILSAGIRQLLVKSLQSTGVDLQTANAEDAGQEFYFITHSLGSYLSLAALDSDWLGKQSAEVPQFKITPEEKNAADYFSAHTAGFYFLANQIELLELARVSASDEPAQDEGSATPATKLVPRAIAHWGQRRQHYLNQRAPAAPKPQIIAWSDPNDLLSWEVPDIDGVRVINRRVRNSGFKIPPFFVSPIGAHGNYAKNTDVLRVIFKPSGNK